MRRWFRWRGWFFKCDSSHSATIGINHYEEDRMRMCVLCTNGTGCDLCFEDPTSRIPHVPRKFFRSSRQATRAKTQKLCKFPHSLLNSFHFHPMPKCPPCLLCVIGYLLDLNWMTWRSWRKPENPTQCSTTCSQTRVHHTDGQYILYHSLQDGQSSALLPFLRLPLPCSVACSVSYPSSLLHVG
jgi:hypothetical protein